MNAGTSNHTIFDPADRHYQQETFSQPSHPMSNTKKKVVVTVISDLATDQRVHKVCQSLHENGYDIYLIGCRKKDSLTPSSREYRFDRLPVLFQKKIPFYLEFNFRLFFKLLFTRADIYLGNDLDVMPATYSVSAIRRKPVVYDTHEYYLGMNGLDKKPVRRKIWKSLESFIFPRVDAVYSVSDAICNIYKGEYHRDLKTVRNLPFANPESNGYHLSESGEKFSVPPGRKILLFQGAGINMLRGVEELVLSMKWLDPQCYHLIIVGAGHVMPAIRKIISEERLEEMITLLPRVPFPELRQITEAAHLGLSLDKPENSNMRYGLPNKLFDYLHAGVPVLASRLVEVEKIITQYNVGTFIESHDPRHIASVIEKIFSDPQQLKLWKENTAKLRKELNWENESKIVLEIFKQVEGETVN